MITVLVLSILLIVLTLIVAIISGSIMILLKFGWVIVCVLLIIALVKYLKNEKKCHELGGCIRNTISQFFAQKTVSIMRKELVNN